MKSEERKVKSEKRERANWHSPLRFSFSFEVPITFAGGEA